MRATTEWTCEQCNTTQTVDLAEPWHGGQSASAAADTTRCQADDCVTRLCDYCEENGEAAKCDCCNLLHCREHLTDVCGEKLCPVGMAAELERGAEMAEEAAEVACA